MHPTNSALHSTSLTAPFRSSPFKHLAVQSLSSPFQSFSTCFFSLSFKDLMASPRKKRFSTHEKFSLRPTLTPFHLAAPLLLSSPPTPKKEQGRGHGWAFRSRTKSASSFSRYFTHLTLLDVSTVYHAGSLSPSPPTNEILAGLSASLDNASRKRFECASLSGSSAPRS